MKIVTFFLFLLGLLNTAFGQTKVADIIKKVNETYSQNKSVKMTARYDLFSNYSTSKVFETKEGVLKKDGGQLCYKIGDLERFETKKLKIIANHEEKVLIVQPNQDKEDKTAYSMDVDLESVLSQAENVYIEDKGTYWFLSMPLNIEEMERVNISVEKNTYFISKAIIYYRNASRLDSEDTNIPEEKPRLEITYKMDTQPKFTKDELSEKHYIQSNGAKIQLSEHFKDYQLINYCDQSKNKQNSKTPKS